MGMLSYYDKKETAIIKKSEVSIAKNHLSEDEIKLFVSTVKIDKQENAIMAANR